jgi:signal transduction histidine kinase
MTAEKISRLIRKSWGIFGGVSVRSKIFGLVLGSTLLLSLSIIYQVRITLHDVLETKSQEEGISVTRDVAARATDLILINDLFSLHKLLVETKENYPDVRYAFVLDTEKQVLAHTFGDGFPLELIDLNAVESGRYQNTVIIDAGEDMIWDVAVPIFNGQAGTARVGISDASAHRILQILSTQLVLTILVVLSISLLAATTLTWVMTRPVITLAEAAQKITNGDFTPRVERWADDEIGDLSTSFNQMANELGRMDVIRQEREQLRRQFFDGIISAQEDERKRIARELHDGTSQSLTSLIIGLRNLSETCGSSDLRPQIQQLREETNRTLDDVHALAVQLRPAVLDDLGLKAAVDHLVEEWQSRHRIVTDVCVYLGNIRLSDYIETAVYRIIQEALTNIAKHAQASSVSVLVERRNSDVVTIIEDDGQGFDIKNAPNSGRLGLLSMQERAELLGGTLVVESTPKQGTSIFVTLPENSHLKEL